MNLEEYFSRLKGVVSPTIATKKVVTVGCGAGSTSIVALARSGVGRLDLVDFDRVEAGNLCRTAYGIDHVGKLKVDCLTELVHMANPFSQAIAWPIDIARADDETLREIFGEADLVIAGTDSFQAQALINLLSIRFETPAVFIGIHNGGTGGRIVWSIPGRSPCYRCVSQARYAASDADRDLKGENGSLLDGLLIDMVAMRIALSILEEGQDSRMGRFFDHMRLRTEVVVGAHPDHKYSNTIKSRALSALPDCARESVEELDHMMRCTLDTLWLPTERDPNCPDCACLYAARSDEACLVTLSEPL